jgi:hypothetical protein
MGALSVKQLEIEFFWPLTEQVPLDLDFSQCSPHLYYLKAQGQPREGPFATGTVYATTAVTVNPVVTIKADHLTIQTKHMPWYRKLAYKLMGFKWE